MTQIDFSNTRVLIAGDIMLDKYYFGQVERISPEAPVPIVNIRKEESRLGGASNVANNISSLGGRVFLSGAIGHDFFGKEIERMARKQKIDTAFIKTNAPTITKARIIGGKQQIVRLDYEERVGLSAEEERKLFESLKERIGNYQILVISDYGKGFVSDTIGPLLIQEAKKYGILVIVDPKGKNWSKYRGADIITPNVKELGDISGKRVENADQEIEQTAQEIIRQQQLNSLLVTRSEKGMSYISETECIHIPTHSEEVFDVSGAGDTVVATLSLALAQRMPIREAMKIANIAAGIVVRKIGTATLTAKELEESIKKEGI